jgi:hypothetical protein
VGLLDEALAYAARGWPVFPCAGKKPLTPHGFKDASTNPNVIERWWLRHPDANIALATGKDAGVFVIDVDSGKVPEAAASLLGLEKELGGELPETLESTTGTGGRHLFFAWSESHEVRNKNALRPGIDVRGEGGYVILPPSIHPDTKRPYVWFPGRTVTAYAGRACLDFLAPPPKNVAPWERLDPAPPRQPRQALAQLGRTPVLERARKYLRECDPAIQGRGGHNALLWAARAMVVGFDFDDATALELLWSEYNPRCQPPWDESVEADRRDFERKVGQARATPSEKRPGWLLDELNLRNSSEALMAIGAASAQALLAASTAKRAETAPTPIDIDLPEVTIMEPTDRKPFPVELFPEPIANFCRAVAESHVVDTSFVALPMLAVAGAAMGNAWRLELKKGFIAPPILWVALVASSGANKSGPLRDVVRPLRTVIPPDKIPNAMLNPQGQNVVSDATLEAVVMRMRDNPRGLLVFRDELAGWAKGFNAYRKGGGGDEQAWLEFNGGGEYAVDRKTNNERIEIPSASCAIVGGIQPKVLVECFDPQKFSSGLVPRILIACPPRTSMYWTEAELDPNAEIRWIDAIHWLRATPFDGLDSNRGRFIPRTVFLTPEAKACYVGFFDAISLEYDEAAARGDENMQAFLSKARTQAGRLALIHHGLRLACGDRDLGAPVALESMQAAVAWMRWCLDEQLRVYGFGNREFREREAKELAKIIRERMPTPSATVRQIQRINARRWGTRAAAQAALSRLVELGHGRWGDEKQTKVVLHEEKKSG